MEAQKSLLEDLCAMFSSVPGAAERERLLQLLPRAVRFDLSDPLVTAVSDTLAQEASTIEHNLDFLDLPAPVCWFEWNEDARRGDTSLLHDNREHPVRTGVLLAIHEEDPSIIVGTTAWRLPDGRVDHAASFFSWNEPHLAALSRRARQFFSRDQKECWARIMSMVYTHIPSGFEEEMDVLRDIRAEGEDMDRLKDDARRDASAEALFMMGLLLMTQTSRLQVTDEEHQALLSIDTSEQNKFSLRRRTNGFYRRPQKKGHRLEWQWPHKISG
ncbi:hypothetical protein [Sulfitobacter sp. R18_1]|uniref:hypothetical protein n=1 Tax=Sulfitobacter sp. R18_1 TaxID=2821104 RepID=UPI001ADA50C4|nr:hypothetical protein [Sulfitobacter sp. R18_1]MBO9428443.1 hypothetical protein [Sulfitobacter sp. R18_1]